MTGAQTLAACLARAAETGPARAARLPLVPLFRARRAALDGLSAIDLARLASCRELLGGPEPPNGATAILTALAGLRLERRALAALRRLPIPAPQRWAAAVALLSGPRPGLSGEAFEALLGVDADTVAASVPAGLPWHGTDTGHPAQSRIVDCVRIARWLPAGGHAVDLGCGLGRLGFVVAALDPEARFTGLEVVPQRVAEARRVAETLGLARRVRVEVADLSTAAVPAADLYYAFFPFPETTARRVLSSLAGACGGRPFRLVLQGTWPDLDVAALTGLAPVEMAEPLRGFASVRP